MPDQSRELDRGGLIILADNYVISSAAGKTSGANAAPILRYSAIAVNFNAAATDTSVAIGLPSVITAGVTVNYVVESVRITNASASISTATIGVFTAASAGGATIAADQAVTVTATATATNNNTMALTLTNANTMSYVATTLFVRIGTGQGTAATADVNIYLRLIV